MNIKVFLFSMMAFSFSCFANEALTFDNVYARATAPGAESSAVFGMLKNDGDTDVTIVSASADVSEEAELHTVIEENDVMQMRQVSEILVPAHGNVVLQPGAYHVMLIGLHDQLVSGSQVNLTLDTQDGQSLDFVVPVEDVIEGLQHVDLDHAMAQDQ